MRVRPAFLAITLALGSTLPAPGQPFGWLPMLRTATGGAIGETAEWALDVLALPFALGASPIVYRAPYQAILAAPISILATGATTQWTVVKVRIAVPNDRRLIGQCVHLQAAEWVSSIGPWSYTPITTWILADPATPRFRTTPLDPALKYFAPRESVHGAAMLKDGTVLFTGDFSRTPGSPSMPGFGSTSAQLFDPAQNCAQTLSPMQHPRTRHAVQPLADGSALIVGGNVLPGAPYLSPIAELYNPVTRTFLEACWVPHQLYDPLTAVFRDPATRREFVLVVGPTMFSWVDEAFLYDVQRRLAIALPQPLRPRREAALCPVPGGVLLTGGTDGNGTPLADAEMFLLATRSFHPWGRMHRARKGHAMIPLDATRFLILGGSDGKRAFADAELFDAATGTSVPLPLRLCAPRENFTAVKQPDGSVLVVGGSDPSGATPGRTPERLTLAGSTPFRPLDADYTDVDAFPLSGGSVVAIGLRTLHHFP